MLKKEAAIYAVCAIAKDYGFDRHQIVEQSEQLIAVGQATDDTDAVIRLIAMSALRKAICDVETVVSLLGYGKLEMGMEGFNSGSTITLNIVVPEEELPEEEKE